jgi:MGT family glycosyltransferase
MERAFDGGLSDLNAARSAHALPPVDHTLDQLRRHESLVLVEPTFDFPANLPPNVRYAGAQLDDPSWAEPWTPPAGDDPLILVATSSTFQDQVPVLRRIATALGRLPVRAVITAGPALNLDGFDAPANTQVVASAPHSEVLRHAAAAVTHGGHGTVVKALAAGVPLVVMPMGRDQGDNAARVVAHGAGIRLKRTAPETAIAEAVERVLGEPSFRRSAGRIGDAIRAGAGPTVAVQAIEAAAAVGARC